MRESRRIWLSNGLLAWELFHDVSDPGHYIEHLIDESWAEYVRRNERVSTAYVALREQKFGFHVLEAPPVVRRSLPRQSDARKQIAAFATMKTLVLQSFRSHDVPAWIERCLASAKAWSDLKGYDYLLSDDSAFELCGTDYLARVGSNLRSITNLCRLELSRRAHNQGYDRTVWLDADILVFDPAAFSVDGCAAMRLPARLGSSCGAAPPMARLFRRKHSAFVCLRNEPDLDFLIDATRHVARHRKIRTNYQVGGDLIKGLRASLDFELLQSVGMLSNYVVLALTSNQIELLQAQARFHGTPVFAANLCASANYAPHVSERQALAAIDVLERSKGRAINDWIARSPVTDRLELGKEIEFAGPDLSALMR